MSTESARRRVMHTHAIRALLLGREDGMTAGELARMLNVTTTYTNGILNDTFGFYIDRWVDVSGRTVAATWMCVQVPANCPRPEPQPQEIEE